MTDRQASQYSKHTVQLIDIFRQGETTTSPPTIDLLVVQLLSSKGGKAPKTNDEVIFERDRVLQCVDNLIGTGKYGKSLENARILRVEVYYDPSEACQPSWHDDISSRILSSFFRHRLDDPQRPILILGHFFGVRILERLLQANHEKNFHGASIETEQDVAKRAQIKVRNSVAGIIMTGISCYPPVAPDTQPKDDDPLLQDRGNEWGPPEDAQKFCEWAKGVTVPSFGIPSLTECDAELLNKWMLRCFGIQILLHAVVNDHIDNVADLIEEGVDVNTKLHDGENILHKAVATRSKAGRVVLHHLLWYGQAYPSVQDKHGLTPLHIVVARSVAALSHNSGKHDRHDTPMEPKTIIQNQQRTEVEDKKAFETTKGLIRELREAGADSRVPDDQNDTPLSLAEEIPRITALLTESITLKAFSGNYNIKQTPPLKTVDAKLACEGYIAVVVELTFKGNKCKLEKKEISIKDLIYGQTSYTDQGVTLGAAVRPLKPEEYKTTICRWIHLPANNVRCTADILRDIADS